MSVALSSPPPGRVSACSRRTLFRLALLAAVPLPALADPDPGPAAPIGALYKGLEALMREGSGKPFGDRFKQIAPVITQAFDLSHILALSVGVRWSNLTPAVQTQLLKAFRDFTVASYVANFDSYDGQKFEILPDQRSVGADKVVATQIVRANGSPVRIDYVMRQTGQAWQVEDVLLDGSISRVAVQRSDFRSLLDHGGAEALIASLRHKTADLSGGNQQSAAAPQP